MIGIVEQLGLVVVIFVIMLGMGATMRMADFRAAFAQPKGFLIGLLCQFGLMPVIALILAKLFTLPDVGNRPAHSLGL